MPLTLSRKMMVKAIVSVFITAVFLSIGFGFPSFNHTAKAQGVQDIRAMKYGMFVHYVRGLTKKSDGSMTVGLNDLADSLDVSSFANDIASTGVEYIIFTAWHSGMEPLYPSAKMDTWRPGHTPTRDLVGEVIDAVRAKGIKVMLYTHPYDGYEFSEGEKTLTGWGAGQDPNDPAKPNPATKDYTKWNNFLNDIYGELVSRYGSRIDGLFIDEGHGGGGMTSIVDFPRLHATITQNYPNLLTIQNFYGDLYSSDIGAKEYSHWGEFANNSGSGWPSYKKPVATTFAPNWWSSVASGTNVVNFSATDMFKYTVLQAGTNTLGGGVQWAAGPYAGSGWETGVISTLQTVGGYINAIERSIKNTFPSTSYITSEGATIGGLTWGVATKSTDDKFEYIHVLKSPIGNTLTLSVPADGKTFSSARLVSNGHTVALTQNSSGVTLTLQGGDTWDSRDTAIELTVSEKNLSVLNDSDPSIVYTGTWATSGSRGAGDYFDDVKYTTTNGDYFQYTFNGTGIEFITPKTFNYGNIDIYIDNVFKQTVSANGSGYQAQQMIYSITGLVPGSHTLKAVKTSGSYMQLDALKVIYNFSDSFVSSANWTSSSGTWNLTSGEYLQTNTSGNNIAYINTLKSYDAVYEYDFRIVNNGGQTYNWAGFQFRKTTPSDSHTTSGYLVYATSSGAVVLYKPTGGLASVNTGLDFSTMNHMKIVTNGINIKVYVNNSSTPIIDKNDIDYLNGYTSLETGYTSSAYDNVSVTNLTTYKDNFKDSNKWTPTGGTWGLNSGEYEQSSTSNDYLSYLTGRAFANTTYEYDFKIVNNGGSSSNWAGFQFRKTNPGDAYGTSGYTVYTKANGDVVLYKAGTGALITASTSLDFSKLTNIKIVTVGTSIKVYVNNSNTASINTTDSTFSSGYASLATSHTYSHFDNVNIVY